MPREDISFKTNDGVTLRGWFYPPASSTTSSSSSPTSSSSKAPCLVMSHGFSAIKEMGLDDYAESFQASLPHLAILIYDHRGIGTSDTGPHGIRSDIVPAEQVADLQDAITYAQLREEVDKDRIGIWGSSYSGGHVLLVGAIDRRVKAVVSQVPHIDGFRMARRLIRPDAGIDTVFEADRHARATGGSEKANFMPIVAPNPTDPAALPMKDAYDFFMAEDARTTGWQNKVTVRSLELLRAYRPGLVTDTISPTPLLMVVAMGDAMVTPADLALEAYEKAREPKELLLLEGGHFKAYEGENLRKMKAKEVEFMKRTFAGEGEGKEIPIR